MMLEMTADMAGTTGVLLALTAYFLLQKETIASSGGAYLGMNLAAAILIMLSLTVHWNLPAFLLEAAWAIISMYGIYKHIYLHRRQRRRQ